jgi:hypothetical protein
MTSQHITFLLTGLTAGLVTVAAGRAWPVALPMLLTCSVGALFFVAVLTAVTLSGSWPYLSHGGWRIVAGISTCTLAYPIALFTFLIVAGYSGVPTSDDPNRFGVDVWIGLLAAVLVASACVELLAFALTSKWSNLFLFWLAAAGVFTVLLTLAVDRLAHNYWTFYGILLPVGEGLFCWLVGEQILRASQRLSVPGL